MIPEFSITKSQAIEQVAQTLQGPISLDEFVQLVLDLWPSQAKNAAYSVKSSIDLEPHYQKFLLLLDENRVAPIAQSLRGVCFRVPVARQEANSGRLIALPAFQFFWRQELWVDGGTVRFSDIWGKPIRTTVRTTTEKRSGFMGDYSVEVMSFELTDWFKQNKISRNDSVLVTVEDWETGHFHLEHEPEKLARKRRAEIAAADKRLVDFIFDRLEHTKNGILHTSRGVLSAYASLSSDGGYPGSHWLDAIGQDGRMQVFDMHTIRYAEERSLFARLLGDSQDQHTSPKNVTAPSELAKAVFTFRAFLKHRKSLWRRIEIQGQQTLLEMDGILREAFGHDWDHMSGFWRRVRRGNTKRFREIEMATIHPFEKRREADQQIGALGLSVGDQLRYVYDFGDWVEHYLEVEAIGKSENAAEYPRVVEQNKPRFKNCTECAAKGKKQQAVWYCYTCADEENGPALLCDDCVDAHEDHYTEEILY